MLSAVMFYVRPYLVDSLEEMEIRKSFSKFKILVSAVLGVLLHVTLDAFHHPNIQPFMIEGVKPFFGLLSTFQVRAVSFGSLVLCFPVYISHVRGWIELNPSE